MKKIWLIISAILMLTLLFAACSDSADPVETSGGTAGVTEADTEGISVGSSVDHETESAAEDPIGAETSSEPVTNAPAESLTAESSVDSTAEPEPKTVTVSFLVQGVHIPSQPKPQTVLAGECIEQPTYPGPEDGSRFDGWYTDPSCSEASKFDFSAPITSDMTLYAWIYPPETEAPTEDPHKPAYYIEPAFIEYNAKNDGANYKKEIGSAEMMTEGDRTFVRLFPDPKGIGDGYVTVIDVGDGATVANYLAISYRTNGTLNGQMYMGSGERWNGQGDELKLEWIKDSEWHLLVIDLDSSSLTSVRDHLLNYCRLDMFENKTEPHEYLDVEYIAFFDSADKAEAYHAARHVIPAWDEVREVMVHVSFDELKKVSNGAESGDIFTPGTSDDWDRIVDLTAKDADALKFWGWLAAVGGVGRLGYQIDDTDIVYDDAFAAEPEQPVLDAVAGTDAAYVTRVAVMIPLSGWQGSHTVRIVYRSADGVVAKLAEFTVNVA